MSLVFGSDRSDGFKFYDDLSFYQQVSKKIANNAVPEVHLDWVLALHFQSSFLQGNRKGFFVDRFKESSPQFLHHLKSAPDNCFGYIPKQQIRLASPILFIHV